MSETTRNLEDVSLLPVLLSAWSQAQAGALVEKYEMESMPWIYRQDTEALEVETECVS